MPSKYLQGRLLGCLSFTFYTIIAHPVCPILAHFIRQVVDTSRVFPGPSGPHQRHKLKFLAKQHLSRYLEINLYIPDSRIQLSDVRVLLFLFHVLRGPPNALAPSKTKIGEGDVMTILGTKPEVNVQVETRRSPKLPFFQCTYYTCIYVKIPMTQYKSILHRKIQQHESGHDSKEDALAALDLIKFKVA